MIPKLDLRGMRLQRGMYSPSRKISSARSSARSSSAPTARSPVQSTDRSYQHTYSPCNNHLGRPLGHSISHFSDGSTFMDYQADGGPIADVRDYIAQQLAEREVLWSEAFSAMQDELQKLKEECKQKDIEISSLKLQLGERDTTLLKKNSFEGLPGRKSTQSEILETTSVTHSSRRRKPPGHRSSTPPPMHNTRGKKGKNTGRSSSSKNQSRKTRKSTGHRGSVDVTSEPQTPFKSKGLDFRRASCDLHEFKVKKNVLHI